MRKNLPLYHCIHTAVLPLILILLLLPGCTERHHNIIVPQSFPLLMDDGDPASLRRALERQRHYIGSLARDTVVDIGPDSYSVAWLAESLATLEEILDRAPTPLELDRLLREKFTVYQAGGRRTGRPGVMLVTGYYEPLVQGSLTSSPPYIHALYAAPPDLVEGTGPQGGRIFGRKDRAGVFRPYWTRQEISENNLLKGHELVYLKDSFDAFLFHVQGSGKIQLPDGTVRSLGYRSNNGHSYSSIGKLLVDENRMSLQEVDTQSIRRYLTDHPEEASRILYHNRRFIFFGWEEQDSPRGSIGEPLTPGRSVAVDPRSLPMGAVAYLITQRPVLGPDGGIIRWAPLQRFVLPQDNGAAIEGSGRIDLFWGSGEYAEIAAGAMKEMGYLYFLVKKTQGADNE